MQRGLRFNQAIKRDIVRAADPLLRLVTTSYATVTGDRRLDHRLRSIDPNAPLRILIVRLDTIGDVLLSEPAFRSIRKHYPNATIDLIASPISAQVIQGTDAIDRIIPFQAPWHAAWRGQSVSKEDATRTIDMIRRLRAEHYDLGFELRADIRDIAFLFATGARVKIGDSWRGGGWMLDIDAGAPVEAHRVEFALAIAAAAGADPTPSAPTIALSSEDRSSATHHLGDLAGTRYVVFHMGAGFASKCLPVDRFARLATWFGRDRAIVVVGGKGERTLVDELKSLTSVPIHDLVGPLSMKETAAVLEKAELFIGNDSGPMHLAAAVQTPVVTFFGPSEPHKYGPYGIRHELLEVELACRPCDHVHCIHSEFLCMTRLPITEIVRAAEKLVPATV